MESYRKSKESFGLLYWYTVIIIVIWTIIVAGSLTWNIINERMQTHELVKKEAISHFNKDQAIRFWATSHGGVYVPADKRTPPSPFLADMQGRDVVTRSGKHLTLMSPAYMLRQLMEEYSKLYGIKGRITGLKVLNPKNTPDEWERSALKSFERGVKEVFEFTDIKGDPYLRLMRPMIAKKPCLKCHGYKGYKEGDVRGGVGVSVPMTPYFAMGRRAIKTMILTHGAIWFLGLLGIGFVTRRGKHHILELKQAEAEKLSALRRITENVAHEIRNPLTSIGGFAKKLGKKLSSGAKEKDYAEIITSGVDNLEKILSNVLTYSRRVPLNMEKHNINEIVDELLITFEEIFKEESINIQRSLNHVSQIMIDKDQVREVIDKLISNAIDSMPNGGTLTITATKEFLNDNSYVTLKVTDTGEGIPEDKLNMIFEPFFTTKSVGHGHGTGLGLPIIKKIVEEHGGLIRIESKIGKGSAFSLYFPLPEPMKNRF